MLLESSGVTILQIELENNLSTPGIPRSTRGAVCVHSLDSEDGKELGFLKLVFCPGGGGLNPIRHNIQFKGVFRKGVKVK